MKYFLFVFFALFFSCKKSTAPAPEPLPPLNLSPDTTGFLEIHIDNTVNGQPLIMNTQNYTNANGDTFNISIYKYYVSNVVVKTSAGYEFKEANSYYLIDQSNPNSLHLIIKKIPKQDYSSISFLLGVDSAKNVGGVNTGALAPSNNMYWPWNQGYIMAKLEGYSPQSPDLNKKIAYHIGGYAGKFNALRTINLTFPTDAIITPNHTPVLTLKAELSEWFNNPYLIDFAIDYTVTGITQTSSDIVDNYSDMFSVTSLTN